MNFVDFAIVGQNIDLEEVSNTLNITPRHTYKKGDLYYDKIAKHSGTYIEDGWSFNIEIENIDETEEKLFEVVNLLHKNKEYIQQLSNVHDVTLWVTIYQDSCQYHLRFSKNVLSKISELGIDAGITCMQLQEFYTGAYLSN